MKHSAKIIAATLAVGMAVTMSGCGGCMGCNSCAGCNGETRIETLTRSNWYTGTGYRGIQPSFIVTDSDKTYENYKEIITYAVTHDANEAHNSIYSLQYRDGEFATEFYATEYDWTNGAIPKGYASDDVKKEIVYAYKTRLTVSVKYSMKTGDMQESEWFDDEMTTVCYFRASGKNLQPVYSKQTVKSTSPANYQPATLADAYKKIDESYETFYSYDFTKLMCYTEKDGGRSGKEHAELNELDRALFDNASLYTVIRSLNLASVAETVNLFVPSAGGIDAYALTASDAALTGEERAEYTEKLTAKGLYVPKAEEGKTDEGVAASAVSVKYAGGSLSGTTQTVWYASVTDADNNVPRATMLKISSPLSFSLGTLNYSLKEITSTLWNG